MSKQATSRRDFLRTSAVAAAGASMPYWFSEPAYAFPFKSSGDRPVVGCIGTGSRWGAVGNNAMKFGDVAAVCDVDANHAGKGRDRVTDVQGKRGVDRNVDVYEDYRKVLDRDDIDLVTIVTPDHWHSKIAIEAMKAGKDVYCEKPLTLTIEEGKQIRQVQEETKRVFQVGTQQRSEMGQRFLQALAIIREDRIGDVRRVVCDIGSSTKSGPIPKADVPDGLNWDMWLGQAPMTDFRYVEGGRWGKTRCHYEFRWWYEYSGGKLTDWGAHHVDIAQWAIGMDDNGPTTVEPVVSEHPVPFENGHPTVDNEYNAATRFHIKTVFPGDVELHIVSRSKDGNGILFEGTKGRFFVSRRAMKGKPVEDLEKNPLNEDTIRTLYKGKKPGDHMGNFFECVQSREDPISDVKTHHRALTTCHLANIAIRLNRTLNWDAKAEQIVDDTEANLWQAREQRKGYEIEV